MEQPSQDFRLATPREKILDIERRLVRPINFSERRDPKLPRLYEEFMERMTNKSYQLTASESAARRKSWQRISYPGRHRNVTPPSCRAEPYPASDIGASDIDGGFHVACREHMPWSTAKKKSKKLADEEASVMNWPSQELKEMTTYSHAVGRLSESYSTLERLEGGPVTCQAAGHTSEEITKAGKTRRSEGSVGRLMKRKTSLQSTSNHAESYKKLAEFDSEAEHKPGLTELKASHWSKYTSLNNSFVPDSPTYSKQARRSESLGEHNIEHERPSNPMATDSSTIVQRRLPGWRCHTSNSPRNKRIKAQSREQESHARLAEFDAYSVVFSDSGTWGKFSYFIFQAMRLQCKTKDISFLVQELWTCNYRLCSITNH